MDISVNRCKPFCLPPRFCFQCNASVFSFRHPFFYTAVITGKLTCCFSDSRAGQQFTHIFILSSLLGPFPFPYRNSTASGTETAGWHADSSHPAAADPLRKISVMHSQSCTASSCDACGPGRPHRQYLPSA